MELSTIQKREKLNKIHAIGETGPGNAYHKYQISKTAENPEWPSEIVVEIQFQKGPRKEQDSQHGALDADLLEIVRHRLQQFQKGDFASRENACALTHIEEALMWMNRRVEDRIDRQVLGTYNK
jgi:hypothetical protein